MKKIGLILMLVWLFLPKDSTSQSQWVSYSTSIPTKEYEGLKFKLSASVRIEVKDTLSSAQLWARVDKPIGLGFYENMSKRPIRNNQWQTYTIEGTIDSNSNQIFIGVLIYYSGAFFFDDIQLDIETLGGVWKTMYKNDFENGQVGLKQGIGKGKSGINSLYKAEVVQTGNNKFLKIEVADAFDFYLNELLVQKEDTNKVNSLFKMADLHIKNEEREEAIEYFEKALRLSQNIGFEFGRIRYYKGMGDMYAETTPKNIQKAIEMFKLGLEYSKKLDFLTYTAFFSNELARFYYNERNYPELLKYNYIALNAYERLNDKYNLSQCYNLLGLQMKKQKNYTQAIKNHLIALKLRENLNEKNRVGQSLINLGYTYLDMGVLDSSEIYINRAIDIYTLLGDKAVSWGLALSYYVLADLYFKKGDAAEQKNELTTAQSHFKDALVTYKKSQKLYREQYSKFVGDLMDINIGITYYKLNGFVIADSFLMSGLKFLENDVNKANHSNKGDAYLYLSKIDSIRGDWEMAHLNYKRSIIQRDSLFTEENTKKSTAYQMQYEFDIKEAATIAEQEKKELALQKEIELKALNYEYEKKQAAAKNENEKQQLKYEQQLRQQQIEAEYTQKTAQIEAEQKRKEAVAQIEQEKKDALNTAALALSQADVQRKNQERNYFMVGFGLLAALFSFIVYGYLQKQKANTLLQKQKAEIDQKSQQLEKSLDFLKSTQSQLIQSEKMASLGELTAGIAHEIQNPLNFVNNFSEVSAELLEEMKTEINNGNIDDAKKIAEDVIQNLEIINHHGRRADAIVKGMLQHSRSSTGQKELTDINALCDEYLRLAYHGLRAKDSTFNVTMKTDFDSSLEKINIISQDIGRVVLNLLTNAFYAVNERSKNGEVEYHPSVSISTKLTANSQLQIAIKDNGNGIPNDIKEKIFQPFFTTKPSGQGTGLGLSLSYDIITKGHGGELKVETNSEEQKGSEFIIILAT